MGRDTERYSADYGNLLLEVFLRIEEQDFEFVVTDKADRFTCWRGNRSDLAAAQSDAILEAQIFLDPYLASPPEPQWQRDLEPGTHI